MCYLVQYSNPVTNNKYYFRHLNSSGKPIGFHVKNRGLSFRFKSFSSAWDMVCYLSKLGYKCHVIYCKSLASADDYK